MRCRIDTRRTVRGRDRVSAILGGLQLGTCARCGRARYYSRRDARHAARVGAPGKSLRAYGCGGFWHLRGTAGGREFTASPVAAVTGESRGRACLDLLVGVERSWSPGPIVGPDQIRGDA